jgi:cell division protein FtsL
LPAKTKHIVFKKDKKFLNTYVVKFVIALIIIYFLMSIFLFIETPWIKSTISFEVILLSTPFLIVVAISITSIRYTYHKQNGKFIVGWLLATLISLAYSLLSNNDILIPYRHFEYMMAPLAIIVVYGLGGIFSDLDYKELLTNINFSGKKIKDFSRKVKISNKIKIFNIFVIVVLIISLASTVYEVHKSLNASVEEITKQDINAIDWMSTNLDQNTSVIASDHRLSRIVEGYPYFFNTTKDQTENIWETETWYESIDELMGIGKNHSRITHIIIDDIMLNDVVHVHAGCSKYMINNSRNDDTKYAAYNKFNNSKEPVFNLIYRNESIDKNPITYEPIHWIEIYEVNWTYIESVI